MSSSIVRRSIAEGAGTAGLVLTVFGGGYFATKVGASPAESAIIGTLAVVGTFVCVLHAIGSLTGGHINPAVTVSFLTTGEIGKRDAFMYIVSQLAGAVCGAIMANLIWGSATINLGNSSVSGHGYIAECLAAGGLVAVIHGSVRGGSADRLPLVVPSFIAAASFAAPFGFANPAVALAKSVAGGGPSYPALAGLLVCEMAAAVVAAQVVKALYGRAREVGAAPVAPIVANTFEVRCDRATEQELATVYDILSRIIRPTDFAVRHSDGRLLVQLDSADERVRSSLEERANNHLALNALATGRPATTVTIASFLSGGVIAS